MSFYGNSYQYLAETFAHIVMKNLGLENVNFPELSDEEKDPVFISATEVKSGLEIGSGNRWITLKPVYGEEDKNVPQGFQIWHDSPSESGELTKIVPDILSAETSEAGAGAKELEFEGYFKFPTVTYDQAGHVTTAEDAIYFKMPADPTFRLEERVDKVEKDMVTFQEKVEKDVGDLKTYVDTEIEKVETIQTNVQNIETNLNSKLTSLDKAIEDSKNAVSVANNAQTIANGAKTSAEQAEKTANSAVTTVNAMAAEMIELAHRVSILENK